MSSNKKEISTEWLLDKYHIQSKIGRGGFSSVYKAVRISDGKDVAIKALKIDSNNTSFVNTQRVEQEYKNTSRINSNYVIKLYSKEQQNDKMAIVMEYIDGETLDEIIKQRKYIETTRSVSYTMQVLKGLKAMHKEGVIHRDIKPSNLMISSHGKVKIIDLGISKSHGDDKLTRTGKIVASIDYTAPELLKAKPANEQSDIFSVGALMYEMIVGSKPYAGGNTKEKISKIKHNPFPNATAINGAIPQALSNVILKATSTDLTKRYQNIDEFIEDLTTCLDSSRAGESTLKFNGKKEKFLNKFNSKKTLMWMAIILGLMVIATTTILIIWLTK
ncbi:MAG: serine/threonine protein kinase [Mollicutes bacterium PWAP]|nr:serine/threonine protein kinase [Mollicutes bacterium PWAP]